MQWLIEVNSDYSECLVCLCKTLLELKYLLSFHGTSGLFFIFMFKHFSSHFILARVTVDPGKTGHET